MNLSMDNFKEVVKAHKEIEQLTRELLYQLVDRIEVYQRGGNRDAYTQRIEIFFHHIGTPENVQHI